MPLPGRGSQVRLGGAHQYRLAYAQTRAAQALEFAVGAQPSNGPALVSRGLALKSVPDEDVLLEARAYADLLAENKPAGMAAIKNNIRMLNRIESFKDLLTSFQAVPPARETGPGDGLRQR